MNTGGRLRANKGLTHFCRENVLRCRNKRFARRFNGKRVPTGRARRTGPALPHLNVVAPACRAVRHVQTGLPRPRHHVEDPPAAAQVVPLNRLAYCRPVRISADIALINNENNRNVAKQRIPNLFLERLDPRARPVDHVPDHVNGVFQGLPLPHSAEKLLGA